jgi:hypothetical protein
MQELGLEAVMSGKVTLHPDGQRIAFAVQEAPDSASDVWVMNNFLPAAKPTPEASAQKTKK